MMAWASDPVATAFMTCDAYTSRDALLTFLCDVVLPRPWSGSFDSPAARSPVALWVRCP
jgi:hypothetical protein